MSRPRVHAVVIAGGAGTRFWPLSREARPKPLLAIGAGRTLLGETLARARRLAGEERVWMVCGRRHARAMRRAAGLPGRRVLVEPRPRNTAAAIAFAAHRIVREDPEATMAVLSADHRIPDTAAFVRAMRRAAAAAGEGDLLTIGVRPTRPETGYGYIRLGAPVAGHPDVHEVTRFVEKPDAARARRYVKRGDFFWNAGIFVWRASAILEALADHAPAISRALAPLGTANARALPETVASCFRRAPAEPIDTAVLERSPRVRCLPVDFHWNDVGTWKSLAEEVGVTETVTRVIQGEAVMCDAQGNLVAAADRPVALVGVSNLAVVDAGDALLVADLDRSGEVRDIVEQLRRKRRDELL